MKDITVAQASKIHDDELMELLALRLVQFDKKTRSILAEEETRRGIVSSRIRKLRIEKLKGDSAESQCGSCSQAVNLDVGELVNGAYQCPHCNSREFVDYESIVYDSPLPEDTQNITTPDVDARDKLVRTFVPGLYACLTIAGFTSLVIAGSLIGVAILISEATGVIPMGIILALGVGGVLGVMASVRAGFSVVKAAQVPSLGISLDMATSDELNSTINVLSEEMRTSPPANVVVEFGTGFYVTDAEVITPRGSLSGRTLCISSLLLRLLTKSEFRAILCHELAHFTGNDTIYSEKFYPVYRGTTTALEDLNSTIEQGGIKSIPLLIPKTFIGNYLLKFARIERGIGRLRELRADNQACLYESPEALASALVKSHYYGTLWEQHGLGLPRESFDVVSKIQNLPLAFEERWRTTISGENAIDELSEMQLSHPLDSHPKLKDRLRVMGLETFPDCPSIPFESSAASMIGNVTSIEQSLTELVINTLDNRVSTLSENQSNVGR